MDSIYEIEKQMWSQDDFEEMGWHDTHIYGMIIEKEDNFASLLLDIDYIFDWINPIPPNEYFTFRVAPCTLKFIEVYDLKSDIECYSLDLLEIDNLLLISKSERQTGVYIYEWCLELQEGTISFKSLGFKQYVRKQPMHIKSQVLDIDQRGRVCFDME